MSKKPLWAPVHRDHEAHVHNRAPRLEGEVKNRGTKPVRKPRRSYAAEAPSTPPPYSM